MTKAQLQLISAKYHLLYNSNSYYFFLQKLPSVSAHQPKPKVTPSNCPSHFFQIIIKLLFFCIKVEKPPDVTFDTITPDSLRSEKGLLKVQIADNQP